jgi:hypothetical protein
MKIKIKRNWQIRDKESGNKVAEFCTLEDAEKFLGYYEMQDERDGIYPQNYYEIVNLND